MAEAVLFFLTSASNITGEFLIVDAGMHLASLPMKARSMLSCGQAEKATMQSHSARRLTWLPGVLTGGRISTRLPSITGMFMNRLSGAGVSGGVRPKSAKAAARLSVQLSWCPTAPRSS